MFHFASAGGVLITVIHHLLNLISSASHTVHSLCDTGLLPKG